MWTVRRGLRGCGGGAGRHSAARVRRGCGPCGWGVDRVAGVWRRCEPCGWGVAGVLTVRRGCGGDATGVWQGYGGGAAGVRRGSRWRIFMAREIAGLDGDFETAALLGAISKLGSSNFWKIGILLEDL